MAISDNDLLQYMFEISRDASNELTRLTDNPISKLISPYNRKDEYRLSEQELRIACINAIQTSKNYYDLYFSIETPTKEMHMQSGTTPMSARFDLSLYLKENGEFYPVANIELKAHNASDVNISKDLLKLIKELKVGAWFHVLQNCNRGTLLTLFNKFTKSLTDLKDYTGLKVLPEKSILFTITVIDKRFMISRILDADELTNPLGAFAIDYDLLLNTANNQIVGGWKKTHLV